MVKKSLKFKLIIGIIYLLIIAIALFFLFSFVDVSDLTSYEFIKSNKDIILKYKQEQLLFFVIVFFIFSIIWVLLLGFAMPLLILAGFVFGKWLGIAIVLTATTIGASLLYILAGVFFREVIKEKLASRFLKLKNHFEKNSTLYFMFFRFIGGGGTPYAAQNVLPLLFEMPLKNYVIATFLGSAPSMFVTVSFGSGIESVIDKNSEFTLITVLLSPDIYIPIIGFFILLTVGFVIKRFYFK